MSSAGATRRSRFCWHWQRQRRFLERLAEQSGVSRTLLTPLYKTVGIALVVKVGGGLCRDAGESALAAALEFAGTICALLTALPLLRAVLELITELR